MTRLRCALAAAIFCGCRLSSAENVGTDPNCVLVSDGNGPAGKVDVKVETVATGLEVPWGLAFLPDGAILVTERPGRIRVVRDGRVLPAIASVDAGTGGEGGLLGIALHPDFAQNRLFYLYVTKEEGGTRVNKVEQWKLAADAASATFQRVIVDGIRGAEYHDGGRLRFGPDGMLYVGTGDGREPASSQQLDSRSGKLLRVTPEGAVPSDNPFPAQPVYVLGIRNTQGFDWIDARTLVVTDHGPSGDTGRRGHDEINVAKAGDNLGWPRIYGCESIPGLVTPSLTWKDAAPPGGAAFYTGTAITEWRGSLLVGTLGSKHLHRVVFDDGDRRRVALHEVYFAGDPPNGYGRLRDVIMGPDGQLYVTTSNCDGRGECPSDKDRILKITR